MAVSMVDVPPRTFIYMTRDIPMSKVSETLGEFFAAVYQHVGMKEGVSMPVALYKDFDPAAPEDEYTLEAGAFVPEGTEPGEGMEVREFYSGEALMTVHVGPYDKVARAYEAIRVYSEKEDIELIPGEGWEIYVNDPGEVGLENARTEVYVPVKE